MKTNLKLSLIAGLLVAAGAAYSQGPMGECGPAMGPGMNMRHDHMGKMDPARMQAMMEKRDALLKAQLKLTPAQEGAWKTFVDARKPMVPPADLQQRPDPVEMAKLTTPERLDKMKAMREEHMKTMTAAMAQHEEATRAFYAALTPEQQKVFDAVSMQGHRGAMGSHHGKAPMPVKP